MRVCKSSFLLPVDHPTIPRYVVAFYACRSRNRPKGVMKQTRMESAEKAQQSWRFIADSLPQIICLLDAQGRVVRANHTIQRWGWDDAAAVRGIDLHEVLHGACDDPQCYLGRFCVWGSAELLAGRHAQCSAYDPVIDRHLAIHAQPTDVASKQWSRYYGTSDLLAVVTVDDISAMRMAEERILRHKEAVGERSRIVRASGRQVSADALRPAVTAEGGASPRDGTGTPEPLVPTQGALNSTLLGILLEAVDKILHHAKPESISVSVTRSDEVLRLCIEEHGKGGELDARHAASRLGTMKQRAELSGGAYELKSAAGQGTRISISWPLKLADRA